MTELLIPNVLSIVYIDEKGCEDLCTVLINEKKGQD